MQQRSWSKVAAAGLVAWALLEMTGSLRAEPAQNAPLASASATSASSQGGSAGPKDPRSDAASEPAIAAEGGAATAPGPKVVSGKDLADTVLSDGRFTTLAQAVRTAGLLPLLKAKGPYTFFAPTDDGWKKLPSDTREKLLADPARLKAVLSYHILRARVDNVGLHKLRNALTMGGIVQIDYTSGVKVNGFQVVSGDIACRNGIMHALDGVLLPTQRSGSKPAATKKPAAGKGKVAKQPAPEQ